MLSRPAEREAVAEDRAAEAAGVCFVVGAETAVFVFAACRLVFRAAAEDCLTTGRLRAEEEERLSPVVGVVGELDCEAAVGVLTVLLLVFASEYEGLAGLALRAEGCETADGRADCLDWEAG